MQEEEEKQTRGRRDGSEDTVLMDSDVEESREQSGEEEESVFELLRDEEFFERVSSLDDKEWREECRWLMKEMDKDGNRIDEWITSGICERCEDSAIPIGDTARWAMDRSQRALLEYARRYVRALKERG